MVCRTRRLLHFQHSNIKSANSMRRKIKRRKVASLITQFVLCVVTSSKQRKRCARYHVCTSTTGSVSTNGSCTTANARSASTSLPSTRRSIGFQSQKLVITRDMYNRK
eukprot:jgi/Phyca11/552648/estExt2_Genewise1Plus.C_PHYCAscaffold_480359